MSVAGVRSVRLFPEWNGFEPVQGNWEWGKADALVKSAAENNIHISGLLFGSTPWTKDRSHAFPMKHLDDWSSYASTVVGHYKDSIHDWEVWNEGNAGFNDGHNTTSDYAALTSAAYEAAKKADPNARVGMSVASFDAPYLDQAILAQAKAGKPNKFDFLCIHPYEVIEGIETSDGEIPYLWMSRLMRDALKADAPAKANADIWITEVGTQIRKDVTETAAARTVVKSYVMAIAQGISRVMWFEGQDPVGEDQGFGLLNRQGNPRASYNSFKTMTENLGQTPRYQGWLALGKDGKGYGFVFQSAGATSSLLVAWMPAGGSDNTVTFTGDVQTIDSLSSFHSTLKAGQPLSLTDTPVFVVGLPVDRVDEARANSGKNFPWGGDYSASKSVSIQFGPTTVNNGVMQTGHHSMPPYQFPDGSGGIELRDNPAASFYVHPSFASFKTADYYIRLTLRRTAPGNVGMNFSYEVADNKGQGGPMRHSGGWFSLAADSGWQTYIWHVTDACFSKMWGYDFSFNPEKSVVFVIGKVEVSTQPFDN